VLRLVDDRVRLVSQQDGYLFCLAVEAAAPGAIARLSPEWVAVVVLGSLRI